MAVDPQFHSIEKPLLQHLQIASSVKKTHPSFLKVEITI